MLRKKPPKTSISNVVALERSDNPSVLTQKKHPLKATRILFVLGCQIQTSKLYVKSGPAHLASIFPALTCK